MVEYMVEKEYYTLVGGLDMLTPMCKITLCKQAANEFKRAVPIARGHAITTKYSQVLNDFRDKDVDINNPENMHTYTQLNRLQIYTCFNTLMI